MSVFSKPSGNGAETGEPPDLDGHPSGHPLHRERTLLLPTEDWPVALRGLLLQAKRERKLVLVFPGEHPRKYRPPDAPAAGRLVLWWWRSVFAVLVPVGDPLLDAIPGTSLAREAVSVYAATRNRQRVLDGLREGQTFRLTGRGRGEETLALPVRIWSALWCLASESAQAGVRPGEPPPPE